MCISCTLGVRFCAWRKWGGVCTIFFHFEYGPAVFRLYSHRAQHPTHNTHIEGV